MSISEYREKEKAREYAKEYITGSFLQFVYKILDENENFSLSKGICISCKAIVLYLCVTKGLTQEEANNMMIRMLEQFTDIVAVDNQGEFNIIEYFKFIDTDSEKIAVKVNPRILNNWTLKLERNLTDKEVEELESKRVMEEYNLSLQDAKMIVDSLIDVLIESNIKEHILFYTKEYMSIPYDFVKKAIDPNHRINPMKIYKKSLLAIFCLKSVYFSGTNTSIIEEAKFDEKERILYVKFNCRIVNVLN